MAVQKISAASELCKDVTKLLRVGTAVQIYVTVHVCGGSAPSSGVVFAGAFELSV